MILDKKTSAEIAKEIDVSYPTVFKYVKTKLGDAKYNQLKNNGKEKKASSNYIDGRAICRKYKKPMCQACGCKKNLEIHHISPVSYNSKGVAIVGNHNKDNLMTLCNSCHQKVHYRKLGRKNKVTHDVRTGRFLSNEI